jgi:hypothetical protein
VEKPALPKPTSIGSKTRSLSSKVSDGTAIKASRDAIKPKPASTETPSAKHIPGENAKPNAMHGSQKNIQKPLEKIADNVISKNDKVAETTQSKQKPGEISGNKAIKSEINPIPAHKSLVVRVPKGKSRLPVLKLKNGRLERMNLIKGIERSIYCLKTMYIRRLKAKNDPVTTMSAENLNDEVVKSESLDLKAMRENYLQAKAETFELKKNLADLQTQNIILNKRVLREQTKASSIPKTTSIVPTSLEVNL